MHPRNIHNKPYDIQELARVNPDLSSFVSHNSYGTESIDFSDPKAVFELNKALLKLHYQVDHWSIPENFLCPPIPGRADYIHHIKDLISEEKTDAPIKGIDIGVGANAIYPILGSQIYNWNMLGTDIEEKSVEAARENIKNNSNLQAKIEIRQQKDRGSIFKGMIRDGEFYHFSMCNPPFHASEAEAKKAAFKKWKNLGLDRSSELNFGGQANELWCNGGEALFIKRMIKESKLYGSQVGWFTCLVSRKENLPRLYKQLKKSLAQYRTVEMQHGNKKSRFIAWRFEWR